MQRTESTVERLRAKAAEADLIVTREAGRYLISTNQHDPLWAHHSATAIDAWITGAIFAYRRCAEVIQAHHERAK